MHLMICVLAIQFHVIQVQSTHCIICFLCFTIAFKLSSIGIFAPQTKTSCVFFTKNSCYSIHQVGNIKAFTVPTTHYISIINQLQECIQQFIFCVHENSIFKSTNYLLCICLCKCFRFDYQTNSFANPIQVYTDCCHWVERITGISKAFFTVKVNLDIEKCLLQFRSICSQIVIS